MSSFQNKNQVKLPWRTPTVALVFMYDGRVVNRRLNKYKIGIHQLQPSTERMDSSASFPSFYKSIPYTVFECHRPWNRNKLLLPHIRVPHKFPLTYACTDSHANNIASSQQVVECLFCSGVRKRLCYGIASDKSAVESQIYTHNRNTIQFPSFIVINMNWFIVVAIETGCSSPNGILTQRVLFCLFYYCQWVSIFLFVLLLLLLLLR